MKCKLCGQEFLTGLSCWIGAAPWPTLCNVCSPKHTDVNPEEPMMRTGAEFVAPYPEGYNDGRAQLASANGDLYLAHPDQPVLRLNGEKWERVVFRPMSDAGPSEFSKARLSGE